ncbi:MAG: SURF1 family protein [Azospirillaceae bacterium]
MRRLPLVPTLLTTLMLIVLLGLGVWQVERRVWKNQLIAEIEERMAEEPMALPMAIDDPEHWEFRRVTLTGVIDRSRVLVLANRTLEGQSGVHWIAPVVQQNGATILADLGWVPFEMADADPREHLPVDEVTLTGTLRLPGEPGWFTPDNDVAGNRWFWTDLAAMAEAAEVRQPMQMLLAVGGESVPWAPPPQPVGTVVDVPNNHLQYAVTWFALAGVLAVIYTLFAMRQPRRRRGGSV